MKQDLNLPADYAVLSDNEMTYTQGGGVISTLLGLYRTCTAYRKMVDLQKLEEEAGEE